MASDCGEEDGGAEGASWRLIGPVAALSSRRCRLIHSSLGRGSDVCLFYVKGEFFAMDARCAHSGKPSTFASMKPTGKPRLQKKKKATNKPNRISETNFPTMLYNPPFAFKRSRDEWFPVAPGGPLCEGDIEEVEGVLQVFCPWHDYNFDLRTGKSGTSLQVGDETRSNSGSIIKARLLKKKKKEKQSANVPSKKMLNVTGTRQTAGGAPLGCLHLHVDVM